MELTRGQRWLNRWWPSRRLRTDPLQELLVDGRYAPVSIANWKLIAPVARSLLVRRVPRPLSFNADRRLTVVIPFRDREQHLAELLPVLKAQLHAQQIQHRIVVVEQAPGSLFNRGRLINIGVHFTADSSDYYCLHDVDAIPLSANYSCPSQPLRLVNRIQSNGTAAQKRHNDYYFSGAVSIRKEQMFAVNGFSNEYWGWGKEDDDFFFRLLLAGHLCYFDQQGEFHDLPNPKHQQVKRSGWATPAHVRRNRRQRSRLLRGLVDPAEDGLNTLRYEVTGHVQGADCERICVRW